MSRTRPDNDKYHYNDLHLFGVSIIFNDLRNYQQLIEELFDSQRKKLEAEFNEIDLEIEAKKAGEFHREYYQHLLDSYIDKHRELEEFFPHNFRAFFLTQIIAAIEAQFKKVCNHFGKFHNQKFSVDDLNGTDDLEKCKKYLHTISKVDFSKFEPEWVFIKNCKLLRNKIVHHEGFVKIADTKIMSFIKESPSIEHDEITEHHVKIKVKIVDKLLNENLIKSGEKLIQKLIDSLEYSC